MAKKRPAWQRALFSTLGFVILGHIIALFAMDLQLYPKVYVFVPILLCLFFLYLAYGHLLNKKNQT